MIRKLGKKPASILFALILLSVGFVGGQFHLRRTYQEQLEASYRRALLEFAAHVQQMTVELGRAPVAVSGSQRHLIAANMRRLIYASQGNLGELPWGEIQTQRISGLLAAVYEQTYRYEQSSEAQMEELHEQMCRFNEELQKLLVRKQQEFPWVSWSEYLTAQGSFPDLLQAFAVLDEGLAKITPPVKAGEITGEVVPPEEARKIAGQFSGRKDLDFAITGESEGGPAAFLLAGEDEKCRIMMEVTKRGGLVLWMTTGQTIGRGQLDLAQLIPLGSEFLRQRGFSPVHLIDAQMFQNRATLTFVRTLDSILDYTEPLKVQLSAADGTILGFWATPSAWQPQEIGILTEFGEGEEWRIEDKIRAGVEVLDQKMVLLPGRGQEGVLTKRLGVRYGEEHYLIYLNSASGEEELIVPVASAEFF